MEFPVIAFPSSGPYSVAFRTEAGLARSTYRGFKSGWHTDLRIFDSMGRCSVVRSVEIERPRNRLILFLGDLVGAQVRLAFTQVEELPAAPLDELKERIYASSAADPGWYAKAAPIKERKERIASCQTHREVIECFIW
jgi:hypothetical protein